VAISFPYPTTGKNRRPGGQGCSTCVHREYCQAFYWYYRYEQFPTDSGKNDRSLDQNLGTACEPWSDDENDRITEITAADLAENERLAVEEDILTEPFRNGITDPVTANDHEEV